jgi:hypothetical protein
MTKYAWYKTTGEEPEKIAEVVVQDGNANWTMDNKNIREEIERCPWALLMMRNLDDEGHFNWSNPKHVKLLPVMYRSPYLYCQKEKDNG